MNRSRIIIYTKDLCRITGKSHRSCRRMMKRIKSSLGKDRYQLVTLTEFCTYMKFSPDEIRTYLS